MYYRWCFQIHFNLIFFPIWPNGCRGWWTNPTFFHHDDDDGDFSGHFIIVELWFKTKNCPAEITEVDLSIGHHHYGVFAIFLHFRFFRVRNYTYIMCEKHFRFFLPDDDGCCCCECHNSMMNQIIRESFNEFFDDIYSKLSDLVSGIHHSIYFTNVSKVYFHCWIIVFCTLFLYFWRKTKNFFLFFFWYSRKSFGISFSLSLPFSKKFMSVHKHTIINIINILVVRIELISN